MNYMNAWLHFKKICNHKYWVLHYCRMCGITWRGIKHDLSKFHPTEFFESVKYYKGNSSPIDECKRINGVSYAWMHHKRYNDHHYETWIDNVDKGGTPIRMPLKCSIEMLCDYLGAGRAYFGYSFTYVGELKWFINKLNNNPAMHPTNKKFIYFVLCELSKCGQNPHPWCLNYKCLEKIYQKAKNTSDEEFASYRRIVERELEKRGV